MEYSKTKYSAERTSKMFNGFSQQTCDFLRQVEENNSRQWYHENKDKYARYVKEPYQELIADLSPLLRGIDKEITLEPKNCLSRIYRDTRFSKSKLLYRSSTWVTFKRPSDDSLSQLCFYVEFTPFSCDCGMGYWAPKASMMNAYRKAIADDPEAFLKVVRPIEKDKELHIGENTYKRMPAGCPGLKGVEKWYAMRNIIISSGNRPPEMAFSADYGKFVAERFKSMAPLYKKLTEIETRRADDSVTKLKNITRQEFEW